jgi:hypothetical protein
MLLPWCRFRHLKIALAGRGRIFFPGKNTTSPNFVELYERSPKQVLKLCFGKFGDNKRSAKKANWLGG